MKFQATAASTCEDEDIDEQEEAKVDLLTREQITTLVANSTLLVEALDAIKQHAASADVAKLVKLQTIQLEQLQQPVNSTDVRLELASGQGGPRFGAASDNSSIVCLKAGEHYYLNQKNAYCG